MITMLNRLGRRPAPQPTPRVRPSGDASRALAVTVAMRGAWLDGHMAGDRYGYVRGWRWGVIVGACAMLLLCAGAVAAAIGLGWLATPAASTGLGML